MSVLRSFLLVGLGGAFGSMLRFGLSRIINLGWPHAFPMGTWIINLLGSLVIGLLFGWTHRSDWMQQTGWPLLATGLCGGFTTFSAFAYENIRLMQQGMPGTAFGYMLLSIGGGLACCMAGFLLAR